MFRLRENSCDEKPELIVIPMVDVMLFLLAFFVLVAGSIVPGLAMKTNPPKTIQKSSFHPKRQVITITVKRDGSIYYGSRRLTFSQLVRLLKGFKRKSPSISVAIDADRDASVQSLVTVLDAVSKAGINSVGLLAKEERKGNESSR